ncbi:hypothetical protein PPERSA_11725 [Pseudocohnilembus persalinus]|uniref:Uncharacterized protein n=1 Tax=Pseudocohnilembus persalinus TaxID=266149 RepID=A0A0V0QGG1_PSEPJ|nr:hypothetical protein PPERSA_11725 [Pseudocohnilembus persalinus]|eukprot:KRX01278.1 hypothetical protein PPERSA_11725 [Pseudocohnilembus persalinus]
MARNHEQYLDNHYYKKHFDYIVPLLPDFVKFSPYLQKQVQEKLLKKKNIPLEQLKNNFQILGIEKKQDIQDQLKEQFDVFKNISEEIKQQNKQKLVENLQNLQNLKKYAIEIHKQCQDQQIYEDQVSSNSQQNIQKIKQIISQLEPKINFLLFQLNNPNINQSLDTRKQFFFQQITGQVNENFNNKNDSELKTIQQNPINPNINEQQQLSSQKYNNLTFNLDQQQLYNNQNNISNDQFQNAQSEKNDKNDNIIFKYSAAEIESELEDNYQQQNNNNNIDDSLL